MRSAQFKKPVASVQQSSFQIEATGSPSTTLYRAKCRNPKCGHEWNAKSADPLKCRQCQTLKPEVWTYSLQLAEAV